VRGLLLQENIQSRLGWAIPSLHALARRWSGRIIYVASDVKDRLGMSAELAGEAAICKLR
jgi:hypothetical protein